MAFYLSPLVDVNEIDLSTTIPAVATSIGVIALRETYKGAEKKQTFITDENDLIAAFGEPTNESYEDLLSAAGFLKYGNKLYATRVMAECSEFSSMSIGEGSGTGCTVDTVVEGGVVTGVVLSGGGNAYIDGEILSIDGNIVDAPDALVKILSTTNGVVTSLTLINGGSGYAAGSNGVPTTSLVVGNPLKVGGYLVGDIVTVVGGMNNAQLKVETIDSEGKVLTFSIEDGGSAYTSGSNIATTGGNGTGFTIDFNDLTGSGVPGQGSLEDGEVILYSGGDDGVDINAECLDFSILPSEDPDDFGDDVQVSNPNDFLWFIGSSRGEWGNNIRIAFLDYDTQQGILNGTLDKSLFGDAYSSFAEIDSQLASRKDFLILVQEKPQRKSVWVTRETFNVSTDPDALDETGTKRFVEDVVNQQSAYIRVSADVSSLVGEDFPSSISQDVFYQFGDGSNGTGIPSDADIIEAYRLYEDPETIDVNLIIDSGKTETVKSDLIAMCEERLDCMTVLDVPKNLVVNNKGNETTELRDWRNATGSFVSGGFNENTSYASIYGNWIEVYDKYNQKYRWLPASGYIAGIYAKTDDVADPWWAPAGLNRAVLTGVRRLAWNPKLGNRDILYSNGINPIVSFAGQGKVVWGQKTMLAKSSAFNRVNVRRLFIVLEKAISTAAKYFLFEPNDMITRNLLVNMINPFLRDVQSRRGIYDFRVICDETNNTPERIDRNELWCDILIKPTRTAEFIVLNFVATKTGASFEEAAQAV